MHLSNDSKQNVASLSMVSIHLVWDPIPRSRELAIFMLTIIHQQTTIDIQTDKTTCISPWYTCTWDNYAQFYSIHGVYDLLIVVAAEDVTFNSNGWHVTPTSSSWMQSTEPSGVDKCGHSSSLSSEPVQRTSSQKIRPLPRPNGGGRNLLGSLALVWAPAQVYTWKLKLCTSVNKTSVFSPGKI